MIVGEVQNEVDVNIYLVTYLTSVLSGLAKIRYLCCDCKVQNNSLVPRLISLYKKIVFLELF